MCPGLEPELPLHFPDSYVTFSKKSVRLFLSPIHMMLTKHSYCASNSSIHNHHLPDKAYAENESVDTPCDQMLRLPVPQSFHPYFQRSNLNSKNLLP